MAKTQSAATGTANWTKKRRELVAREWRRAAPLAWHREFEIGLKRTIGQGESFHTTMRHTPNSARDLHRIERRSPANCNAIL
jgi:hypothetical protein